MFIYRIVHFEVAYRLNEHPEEGYLFANSLPYFTAFDSIAAAILESHLFRDFRQFPDTFRAVEYTIADDFSFNSYREPMINYDEGLVVASLSKTAWLSLVSEKFLVASFPSYNYKNIYNYLINPNNTHFNKIRLSRIYTLR